MSKLIEIQSQLADMLLKLRHKKGWSRNQVAIQLNTSTTQIWRLENTKQCKPSILTLYKLANVYKKDLIIEFADRD